MAVSIVERSGTLWLTLLRPPVNAIDLEMVEELTQTIAEAPAKSPIVLTGKGKSFSAGVDTKAFAAYDKGERRRLVLGITQMLRAIVSHHAPVVAALNGHAIGGGLVLALAADYRIAAAPEGKFGLTEARAGVPFPAGATEVIRNELPPTLLRSLALTSRLVEQENLLAAGVFDQVCQPDSLPLVVVKAIHEMKNQPGFAAVKMQARGALQARLSALVKSGDDPFLPAFGA